MANDKELDPMNGSQHRPDKAKGKAAHILKTKLHTNRNGKLAKKEVHFHVPCRHGDYQYQFNYPHDVSDAELERDLATLTRMAGEQSNHQELHNSLFGQDIVEAGLTAYVTDSVVHIDGMGSCRLLLRFVIRESGQWHKHSWEARTPSELPLPNVVEAYIRAELRKLANTL